MSTGFAGQNELRKGSKGKVDFEAMWGMAAKAGYTLAFEELVTRNESRIYRLALNITQNQKHAEELLQYTFTEAQEHLQEFRGGSHFSTWLVQICIREALQKFQEGSLNWIGLDEPAEAKVEMVPNEMAEWGDSPEKHYTKAELNLILSGALSELSLIHRIVFLLRDVESFSTEEIADLLGLSVPGTRSCLLRARLDVRGYLNRYFNQEVCESSKCAALAGERREEEPKSMVKMVAA
jgi:RNA polymerase sigma-70 factor (ECF subfamily)